MLGKRERRFPAPNPGDNRLSVSFYAPQRERTPKQSIPPASPASVELRRGKPVRRAVAHDPKAVQASLRADAELRRAKRAAREQQGWQARLSFTRRRLKHDGSTVEQRARRVQNRTSPWIPA
jgi:hypothetical protein